MKLVVCVGFIRLGMRCTVAFDSRNGVEGDDGMAASDRVGDERCGFGDAGVDSAIANGIGGPGRPGADAAGLPGRSILLCGGSLFGGASSAGLAKMRSYRPRSTAC